MIKNIESIYQNTNSSEEIMKHEHAAVVLDFSANGIGIIRSLARRGIDVYAFDTEGPYRIGKSRLADCGICPSPLTQEEELLTFLTDFGKRFQAKLGSVRRI